MSFLLDTCVLSELTRPKPDPAVLAWFDAQDSAALFVSALTVGEIERGISLLPAGKKQRALRSWLAELRSTFADRILGVDAAVAALWGELSAKAERSGKMLGAVDGLIAATAIHFGYCVVTRNVRDFAVSGAVLLNAWDS